MNKQYNYYKLINFCADDDYIYLCCRNIYTYNICILVAVKYYYKFIDSSQLKYYNNYDNIYKKKYGEFNIITTNLINKQYKENMYLLYSTDKYVFKTECPGNNYFKIFNDILWQLLHIDFNKYIKIDKQLENEILYDLDEDIEMISDIDLNYIYNNSYMSFDIEVFVIDSFPDIEHANNPITHISIHIKTNNNSNILLSLINIDLLKDTSIKKTKVSDIKTIIKNNKDIDDIYYMTEISMLLTMEFILQQKYDYIISYNGDNFDIPYIINRSAKLNRKIMVNSVNGNRDELSVYHNKYYNTFSVFNLLFSNFIDLYKYTKGNIKDLKDNKLDTVSKKYINSNCILKNNIIKLINPSVQFLNILNITSELEINNKIYNIISKNLNKIIIQTETNNENETNNETNNEIKTTCYIGKINIDLISCYKNYSHDIAVKLALYCKQDAYLCSLLFNKLCIHEKMQSYISICKMIPSNFLILKSTKEILNKLLELCLNNKIAINTISIDKEDYKGATVIEPENTISKGYSSILDFNSLYPNSIMYCNMSPETLIYKKRVNIEDFYIEYNTLLNKYKYPDYIIITNPNIYDTDIHDNNSDDKIHIYIFNRVNKGIIPKLIDYFVQQRKNVRGEIAKLKTDDKNYNDKYNLFDSQQLRFKITANSIYGLSPMLYFPLQSIAVAECCTSFSRCIELFVYNLINDSIMDIVNKKFTFSKNIQNKKIIKYPMINIDFNKKYVNILDMIDSSMHKKLEEINVLSDIKFHIIYGDTDSVFITISNYYAKSTDNISEIHNIFIILSKIINKTLSEYFPLHVMEYEGFITNVIIKSKKKYISEKYENGKLNKCLYMKGLSVIRKETIKLQKEMFYDAYEIFKKNDNYQLLIIDYIINKFKNEIENYNYIDYIKNSNYAEDKKTTYKDAIIKYNENKNNEPIKDKSRFYYMYACNKNIEYNEKFFKNKKKSEYIEIIPKNNNGNFITTSILNKRPIFEFYFPNIATELFESYKISNETFSLYKK